MEYLVKNRFSDGEMWAIMAAFQKFMYDNPNLTEEQYKLAEAALNKLTEDMI